MGVVPDLLTHKLSSWQASPMVTNTALHKTNFIARWLMGSKI